MGGTQSTPEVKVPGKTFYYYPAYGHKYMHKFASGEEKERTYARRVLAGVVSGDKIYVAESLCFTGDKDKSPDQFVKRIGRQVAEGRAYQAAGFTFKGGKWVPCECKPSKAVLTIPIPDGTVAIGKLFVEAVEKIYPKQVKATKPEVNTSN